MNARTALPHAIATTCLLIVLSSIGEICPGIGASVGAEQQLANTDPLTGQDDLAARMVEGIDRFLLRKTAESIDRRSRHWQRDFSSPAAYTRSIEPNRQRLAHILGVRDKRIEFLAPELVDTTAQEALIGRGDGYEIVAVRWPAFGDVHGEGLLLLPTTKPPTIHVVALPDADQLPEQLVGMVPGVARPSQFARRLAESGCRVLVPTLVSRDVVHREHVDLTNREWVYRPAFQMGRHLIGYEVQKVLAAVDWLAKQADGDAKIGLIGYGEGGAIALYASALDPRVDATCVSGYFEAREGVWREPVDRNVFSLLEQFGDAELACLVAPRRLIVEAARGPELTLRTNGGAPGRLTTPKLESVRKEVRRAKEIVNGLDAAAVIELVESDDGRGPFGTDETLQTLLASLSDEVSLAPDGAPPTKLRTGFDAERRSQRQIHELQRHTQDLLRESPVARREFMNQIDTSSLDAYKQSVEPYRKQFYDEIIGRFDQPLLPPNARSRQVYHNQNWIGFEVVLDVFPDVFAYGILLLPKDLRPGQRRPVVVCQHGLEGRAEFTITGNHPAYRDFAAQLADRGFITFSPQNPYRGEDRFRVLQRKANPIKKTLFSVIVPQHQQIVDWLQTLPCVDPDRIAFYGLSYGGKTAMRVPPLVTDYCASICSADFNDWVDKVASTSNPYSYVIRGEYEIFEFNLGNTFNYAEMASLICPRPFMVERGHFDGVAADETVAAEFAKVRYLYQARLGIGQQCAIEWFVGPHTIHGKGSFEFLGQHLKWPDP